VSFQFLHIETYGRAKTKPSVAQKAAKTAKRKGKAAPVTAEAADRERTGWTVSDILDEVERKPGACTHVKQPVVPTPLYGLSVAELRALHERRCAEAQIMHGGKLRRIRTTQHTMLTMVMSHPTPMDQMSDPAKAAEVAEWEQRCLAWLRQRYGEQLRAVIPHRDEAHPHLHAYVVPDDPEMRAKDLHPGLMAKARAMREAEAQGIEYKIANRLGDAAYKAAMRELQDEYHREVSLWCGHTRLGPGRRRLSREEHQAERAQAAAVQRVVVAATAIQREKTGEIAGTLTELRQAKAELAGVRSEAALVVEQGRAKAARLVETAQAEAAQAMQEAQAAAEAMRQRAAADAEAMSEGLRVGADLIETGAIEDIRKREDGELRAVPAPGRVEEVRAALPVIRPALPLLRRMIEAVRARVERELERLVGPLKAKLTIERTAVREAGDRLAKLEQRHLAGIDRVEALAGELGERKTVIEQRNARLVARTLQSARRELERELEPTAGLLAGCWHRSPGERSPELC
jgi:hypothetical protein